MSIDLDIANRSVLLKGMIDDSGIEDEIPLPNIKKPILDKIVAFCSPPEIEKPLRSANLGDVTS